MRVKDLTNYRLREVIEEYYEDNLTVKALLEKYGVKYTSNFIQSVTLYTDEICEVCGGKVKYILKSRTYCKSMDDLNKKCSICGHYESENCYCKSCIEYRRVKEEKEIEHKKRVLEDAFKIEPISIDDLGIKEIVFIGVLKEKGILDNIGVICEKDFFKNMYNDRKSNTEFLYQLIDNGVIKVNIAESDLSYFTIEDDKPIKYYPTKISYNLNIRENIYAIDIKKKILDRFEKLDIEEFWLDICLDECMMYLDIRTDAMNLEIIDDIIRQDISCFIKEILMEYSLGEVLNIIYRSVNYASNFNVEYDVKLEKVHKAIFTNMRKSIPGKYPILPFDRPYELIQTSLSQYICDKIFEKDGDEIFKLGFSIDELYYSEKEAEKDEVDPIKEGLEIYNKLVLQIKELANNNVPKDFIISYLKITEEIYNNAINSNHN